MASQKPSKYQNGLAQQANYNDFIQKPEDVVGMTKEDFEKNKMLFSSEFLLGLEHGPTTPTPKWIVSKSPEDETTFRPPPVKRRIDKVPRESLGKKETFCLPPKRVLFVPKPKPVPATEVSDTVAATTDDATSTEVKPAVAEKRVVEITNLAKLAPRTYADFLRRAGLKPKETVDSSNQNQGGTSLSHVKVPWQSLSYYRSFELRGIYFYADAEDSVDLTTPKLEPWDVDPEWYLKSSEFMVMEPVKLGNQHVQEEHVTNALLMYSSRRGISSKDRTYYKRHGTAGPMKFRPFEDPGRDRKQNNKYPPSYYRGCLAKYLEARASQQLPIKIYKL